MQSPSQNSQWQDHLIIMELASPAEQEATFVAALEKMAAALRSWASVVYLPQAALAAFKNARDEGRAPRIAGGKALDDVQEVCVVREWQWGNQTLLGAFPSAKRIFFGDSIGIYLAPGYMTPKLGLMRRFAASLKSALTREARGGPRSDSATDCYYLALPKAFDRVPSENVIATDMMPLRKAVDDLRPLLPGPLLTELSRRSSGRALVVVVGSNFSEQGLMSEEEEISAYAEYLTQQRFDQESLVLLKPHPRDRMEKVRNLEACLSRMFPNVFTLVDAVGFYLPLETLLMELRSREKQSVIHVCTFSSACLASKYILELSPRIGFGAQLVRKHFKQPFVEARLRHERQLLAACDQLDRTTPQ